VRTAADDPEVMSQDGADGVSRLRRVLLLEDQPDTAALFTLQLQTLGWHVEKVRTEAEALAAASAEPPDAIIIDTLVPAGDGRALVDKLRAGLAGRPCRLIISTIYEPSDFADVDVDAVLALPHHRAALECALLTSRPG
jgi:CheY-like chemotaxis protein